MRRTLSSILLCALTIFAAGCATHAERQWGYTEAPGSYTTAALPPGTTVVGGRNVVGGTTYIPATNTTPNRLRYEHNSEGWSAGEIFPYAALGLGIVDTILHYDNMNRWPRHRHYRRHYW